MATVNVWCINRKVINLKPKALHWIDIIELQSNNHEDDDGEDDDANCTKKKKEKDVIVLDCDHNLTTKTTKNDKINRLI